MKNRVISIVLAVVMIAGMIPFSVITAFAENTGKYIERSWNGEKLTETEQDIPTDAIEITGGTTEFSSGKWYVVSDNITVSGTITVNGTANIILTDGYTLNVQQGILSSAKTLNIYGQEKNTGTLNIEGGNSYPGIENSLGCTLTVHGGTVNATGSDFSAGIGGRDSQIGGTVTVYGGTVNATAGSYGAGIGGGYRGKGGNVKIYGGAVTAFGNGGAEGIGTGSGGDDSGSLEWGASAVIKAGTDKDNATDTSYNGQPYVNIHYHNFIDNVCTICGEAAVITVPEEEATCTQNGHIEYYQKGDNYYSDKDCQYIIPDLTAWLNTTEENGGGMIPAKGHNWEWLSDYEHHCSWCDEFDEHTVGNDYICSDCHHEILSLAKQDATAAIDTAAGNSTDSIILLLADNAKKIIKNVNTVAEITAICDEYVTAIQTLTSGSTAHEHTFANRYTYDKNHHWYACTCESSECKGFVSGFGEHTFDKGVVDGFVTTYTCTECGYQKNVLQCDINKDGNVDANDLILVRIALLSGCDYYDALDCNGDGKFDLLDMIRLKNVCANVGTP